MRKFAKISAVLAAMVLAIAFVGCKDDDDDDDDPSVVTTWYTQEVDEDDDSVMTETIYFYDDSTFKVVDSSEGVNINFATGTYTGDTTKDGNIVITIVPYCTPFSVDNLQLLLMFLQNMLLILF